jgi:hypothetical protein
MNERIKELAIEARLIAPEYSDCTHTTLSPQEQKFAELIVRECLDIVNRHEYSYHEADPLWETAQLIKQHFGVDL